MVKKNKDIEISEPRMVKSHDVILDGKPSVNPVFSD